VWFHFVGFQLVTVWQLMQLAVVGMWLPNLPSAALPLWQLAHCVLLLKLPWSGLALLQDFVEWQLSHANCVRM